MCIVFRNATGNAPQSRQQERDDWITFHFCGYTNEVQCRSQMFWNAAVDFGVILLRYSTVKGVPHANILQQGMNHARSTILRSSYDPRDPSSFSPSATRTSPKVKRTDSAIKYIPLIFLAREFFFLSHKILISGFFFTFLFLWLEILKVSWLFILYYSY